MKLTKAFAILGGVSLYAAALTGAVQSQGSSAVNRYERYTEVVDAGTILDLHTLAQLKAETVDLEMKELADFLNLDAFPQQDWATMSLDEIKEQFDLAKSLTADWEAKEVFAKHPFEGKGINYLRDWMDIINTDITRLQERQEAILSAGADPAQENNPAPG